MTFKISNEASYDLENIWRYTFETWSAEQADRSFNLILDEIEHLSKNPNYGKVVSHIKKVTTELKYTHFIFYKRNDTKQEIEIY